MNEAYKSEPMLFLFLLGRHRAVINASFTVFWAQVEFRLSRQYHLLGDIFWLWIKETNWMLCRFGECAAKNCVRKICKQKPFYDLWLFICKGTLISRCPLTTINMRKNENSIVIRLQDFCSNSTMEIFIPQSNSSFNHEIPQPSVAWKLQSDSSERREASFSFSRLSRLEQWTCCEWKQKSRIICHKLMIDRCALRAGDSSSRRWNRVEN